MHRPLAFIVACAFVVLAAPAGGAQESLEALADLASALPWRPIGPTNMGGRVTDVAVVESRPQVCYVAHASGGVWKTLNHGTTFAPVFDRAGLASIGDVAVAPSRPETLWVGTGEANARNSVSWGDGVWRSTDAGKTWTHAGLRESGAIGRIVIHPSEPDTAYAAAAGNTWAPNGERGLYKTTDGGVTWRRVLGVDDATGCIDVAMHPTEPDTLIAATYERRRDGFDGNDPAVRWGPGSGLWKTRDGGKTWTRLSGPGTTRGLPSVAMGRTGLDWCRGAPGVVYAVIETELIGKLLEGGQEPPATGRPLIGVERVEDAPGGGAVLGAVIPNTGAQRAGLQEGDVILEMGGRAIGSASDLTTVRDEQSAGDTVPLRWRRGETEHSGTLTFSGQGRSPDLERPWGGPLGGQRDGGEPRQGPRGFEQGGIYRSDDAGETWRRVSSLNQRPFYFSQIRVAPGDPADVWHLGIQLFRSRDGGKTWKNVGGRSHVDYHAMWIDPRDPDHVVMGSDGGAYAAWDGATWDHWNTVSMGQFYAVALDNRTPYHVYGGLQDNGTWGGPSRVRGSAGATQADWRMVLGGDGFRCAVDPTDDGVVYAESQYGRVARLDLRGGQSQPLRWPDQRTDENEKDRSKLRFNWNTPFLISPHDPKRVWVGAQRLLVADGGGTQLRSVSADLTVTEQGRLSALAEDRHVKGLLWAGSDDGALQVSEDGGVTWADRFAALPGVAGRRWVACIEPSPHVAGTAYIALDGHRSDDYEPHVFVSGDRGATFARVSDGLPAGVPVRVVREDPHVAGLLYAGTETGVFVRLTGRPWRPLGAGLPVVPVFDLAVHPRDRELVAATHGRSLYVCDVAPLQAACAAPLAADAVGLLPGATAAVALDLEPRGRLSGVRHFSVANPDPCVVWLHLPVTPAEGADVMVQVRDAEGGAVRTLRAPRGGWRRGWNRVAWDLRGGPRAPGGRAARGPGPTVAPGDYRLVVEVGDTTLAASAVTVQADPGDDPGLFRLKAGSYEEWLDEKQRQGGWKGE